MDDKNKYDVCMSISNLNFIFTREFGFNTVSINGFFSIGNLKGAKSKFFRFFIFQNLLKNGFKFQYTTIEDAIESLV